MEEKKNILPNGEVKDEALDAVAGGCHPDFDEPIALKPCPNGCGGTVPADYDGVCSDCARDGR